MELPRNFKGYPAMGIQYPEIVDDDSFDSFNIRFFRFFKAYTRGRKLFDIKIDRVIKFSKLVKFNKRTLE